MNYMNLWWWMTLLWTRIFGRSTSNWSATNNIGDKKWNRSSQLTSCKTIDKRHLSSWTSITCCRMDRSKPPWNHRHLSCHPAETFGNFHRDHGTTACKCFMSVISLLIVVLSIWWNLKTVAVAVAMKTIRLSQIPGSEGIEVTALLFTPKCKGKSSEPNITKPSFLPSKRLFSVFFFRSSIDEILAVGCSANSPKIEVVRRNSLWRNVKTGTKNPP